MALVNETHRLRDLDYEFLRRYDLAGPRYTSYPTAPEWTEEAVDHNIFRAKLEETGRDWHGRPLSIYLHLPFCHHHCTFCACNVIISPKGREVSEPYLARLRQEIGLQAGLNDPRRPVAQFHWGGGTPTYLDLEQIERLYNDVASRFRIDPSCEQSIEIHPPITTDDQLRLLAGLGFNRISMGVQDFNERTQAAIERHQTFERTRDITLLCRELGFKGINYDLVYGLPYQTARTFSATMDKVLGLRPDRVALYNFAFLPERLAHQRGIELDSLPSAEEKFHIFLDAHDRFIEAGYRFIGMDHFALPEDELSIALEQKSLHRNFMGFTTRAGTDLVGMGVSSISSVDNLYAQNVKKLTVYEDALAAGRFPTERGLVLNADDLVRRDVISGLMCQGRVEKRSVEAAHGIQFADYFSEELSRLVPMAGDELLRDDGEVIELTFLGRLLARNIAMIFDAYLSRPRETRRKLFSKTL